MAKKKISHRKAAVEELSKAGIDVASVFIEDLGRLRHSIGAVKHGEKAVQHGRKAVKSAIRSKINKAKKALGLKRKKKR